ncbi:MAG: GCN5-like N-acetyltransferase [Puniceicoccaceae bacterium 5H]|nr:MAG: GCN5-like N-acetyltransferase [Puniceicoccaceae bacterium 5H]
MLKDAQNHGVEIIDYRPEYAVDFARISFQWINAYFKVERHDLEILNHPQAYIIDRGGCILLARLDGEIVGCAALIPEYEDPQVLELSKMGVDENCRGKGVGRILMEACLDRAREMNARRIFLETNSRLGPALYLYRAYGFQEAPMRPSPYTRADTRMELDLAESSGADLPTAL